MSALHWVRHLGLAASLTVAAGVGLAAGPPAQAIHPERWPAAASPGADPAVEARISELLATMRLEEKVGQVIQGDLDNVSPEDLRELPLGSVLSGGDSSVYRMPHPKASDWLALTRAFHATAMEARPGHVPIPLLIGVDAVHGHNHMPDSVIFPHNVALGATHDPDLVRRVGAATAQMVAATGFDWTFAPVVAAPQDLRWGRTYEGFSSDPALVARLSRASILGLQGPPGLGRALASGHIAATAKHFLGDGATRYGEDQGDALVAEDELIRLHAPGYVSAIDAGVMTVMASFSSWNGRKMHGNHALLTDVLKGRMGFDGFVVGDWNGHGQLEGCNNEHCPAAMNAGLDMYMAPQKFRELFANLVEDVRKGAIPMARLDDAVRRILRVKYRLGLFDAPRPDEGRLEVLTSAENRSVAREAVRKSLVLLKNEGVLPIRSRARVLIDGPQADDIAVQTGGWTLNWQGTRTRPTDYPEAETILRAIKRTVEAGGGEIVDPTDDLAVKRPDVAVIIFGELPYAEMQGDLKLPFYNSRSALRNIAHYKSLGIPVVSIFMSGRPLWVNPEINASDAFVAAWLPGTEGSGVADVVVGDEAGRPRFDFSGTLPYPWPRAAVLPPFGAPRDVPPPQFPLGYGQSYAHPQHLPVLSEALAGR